MSDFFDEVKHNLGKYLETAGIKSNELFDTAKIKLEIYGLNREKDDILLHIGSMVYKMFIEDRFNMEKVAPNCQKVTELKKQIKLMEEDMDNVKDRDKRGAKETHKNKKQNSEKHSRHKNAGKNIVEAQNPEVKP